MTTTRGELVPARIYEVNETGIPLPGQPIPCMFNPYEYTVSKTNSYKDPTGSLGSGATLELANAGPQTLKLKLTFDTSHTMADVSLITQRLWELMQPKKARIPTAGKTESKPVASYVVFEWGVFRFVSVITNMTQTFTLFTPIGTPIRAKVDITFTQYIDREDYLRLPQNPTSGGSLIEQVWTVEAGQRLDYIATAVYNDPTEWQRIANHNQITNPFQLRPGHKLTIPQKTRFEE
ncbi:MAG: LysM peptidoglycan-binding domain-containing protein [Anaerolineales bacterium]|nr:LysM peptidoglycan-binding domain-containing protein [Anaerolineales bacterium]